MLSINNVSAGYGGEHVLRNVTLEVGDGEFVGLIGPNGSGKTTLLRVVSGVLPVASGKIMLQGKRLSSIARRDLAKRMACLSQELSLNLSFTVREVALMGRAPHLRKIGGESRRDREVAERAMGLADVSHLADRLITEISGGERQRAFIAMCLAQEPKVLLLDEPTSHLDIGHQLLVLDLIRRLNRESGMTVIAVFHDLNLAAEYCGRLHLLDHGSVQAQGSPHEVITTDVIRQVYGVRVLSLENPVSHNPHIVIYAGADHSGA